MATVKLTDALRAEYQRLFDTCAVNAGKEKLVDRTVKTLASNRPRYEAAAAPVGVPWYFVAAIHNMESSGKFNRHLHNGDPLTARTVHVPKGRPPQGEPPFSWEVSAADALSLRRLDAWQDWSVPGCLFQLEGYNGWGYRLYHSHVLSPYLWGGSQHYVKGKYAADGTWSDTLASKQIGGAVLMRRMAELGIVDLALPPVPPVVARNIRAQAPILRYSRTRQVPYAEELQAFLNRLPGIYVKPDGWPGAKTSDAFKTAFGIYLPGDPRA